MPDELVWFAPNMGSVDYTELFTRSRDWPRARARVDVFKFYQQNTLEAACSICGENTLPAFVEVGAFERLAEWGLATAIEAGAVKEWGCTGDEEARNTNSAIDNIERHGGSVSFVAMDEPLLGGQHEVDGRSCGYDVPRIAAATEHYVDLVNKEHPRVVIGDIEPYPHFSVSELQEWIRALERSGVKPAFFHLDVDIERVRVEGREVGADLRALQEFTNSRGIPFGVIMISNWRHAGSNRSYYLSTMDWIRGVERSIGRPQHVIFQSWYGPAASGAHEIPSNLPEEGRDVYSHTRLVIDGLDQLGD